MRDFTKAVERKTTKDQQWEDIRAGDPEDPIEFRIRKPSASQLAIVIGTLEGFGTELQQAAAAMSFFMSIIHPEDRGVINHALQDDTYPFVLAPDDDDDPDTSNVIDLLFELVEDWSGRPTRSPSVSSESRGRTGKTSTAPARSKASTRSTSRRTASST